MPRKMGHWPGKREMVEGKAGVGDDMKLMVCIIVCLAVLPVYGISFYVYRVYRFALLHKADDMTVVTEDNRANTPSYLLVRECIMVLYHKERGS